MAKQGKPSTPPRWFVRSFWFGHRAMHRVTGGRLGLRSARPDRWGMMRLTTIGRRSGAERVAIVAYLEDGANAVTLATNGMVEALPAWWHNLQANPDAVVDLSGGRREVTAHEAGGEERERLWTMWLQVGDELAGDAAALSREIPVVVLEPRTPAA